MNIVWRDIQARLRTRISERNYETWIKPINSAKGEDNSIVLECPNKFFVNWVREHFIDLIRQELAGTDPGVRDILVRVGEVERGKEASPQQQLLLPQLTTFGRPQRKLNSMYTFDRFVTGECNRLAYTAAMSMSQGDCSLPNLLYFFGKTGLGKSHLSQALSVQARTNSPNLQIVYLTAEDFLNEMVLSLRQNKMEDFKRRYRQECDVLVLEEVHFLGGKEKTQGELTATLDDLLTMNKRVVFTSHQLPREIRRMDSSLRSRLNSGMIITMNTPDFETRVRILQRKADNLGLRIGAEIVEFIAHNVHDDVRAMESCMMSLMARANIGKRPVNMELAQEVVKSFVDYRKNIDADAIKNFVADSFRIPVDQLVSSSRKQSVAYPRSIAIHFCRSFTDMTLETIGEAFDRNHATVLYTLKSLEKKMKRDRKIRNEVDILRNKIERFYLAENPSNNYH